MLWINFNINDGGDVHIHVLLHIFGNSLNRSSLLMYRLKPGPCARAILSLNSDGSRNNLQVKNLHLHIAL